MSTRSLESEAGGNQKEIHTMLVKHFGSSGRLTGRRIIDNDIPIRKISRTGQQTRIVEDKKFFDSMIEAGLHYWDLED